MRRRVRPHPAVHAEFRRHAGAVRGERRRDHRDLRRERGRRPARRRRGRGGPPHGVLLPRRRAVIPLRGRGQAAAAGLPGFLPEAPGGRVFAVSRGVRSTEVTPGGRLRFDALARYLQDAAEDDMADAGFPEPHVWLLRRCAVAVRGYPAHGERVTLRTFCSAIGPRWAERTTTVTGPAGDLMQARAVWAAVAPDTGRPVPLGQAFHRLFGSSAQGRYVSARLTHPGPGTSRAARPWPLRATDFDTVGHVNNAIH